MNKQLITRTVSGLIYVGLLVGACFLGEYGVMCIAFLLAVLAIVEYKRMFAANGGISPWMLAFDILTVLAFTIPVAGWAVALICLILRMVITVYDHEEQPQRSYMTDVAGYVYIGVPLACMNLLGFFGKPGMMVLSTLIMIWLNDTGAFCVGTILGRHKLFPRVSPKKSWEGFVGGLLFCVAFGVCLGFTDWGANFTGYHHSSWFWVVASVVVCLAATFGDFFESVLKRNLGLKDSGNLIPGHGGILDRIDSMLMAMPAMFLLTVIWICIQSRNCLLLF